MEYVDAIAVFIVALTNEKNRRILKRVSSCRRYVKCLFLSRT